MGPIWVGIGVRVGVKGEKLAVVQVASLFEKLRQSVVLI